jgi:hypothetical protein
MCAAMCVAACTSAATNPPAVPRALPAATYADPATKTTVPAGPPHVTLSRVRTADGSMVTVAVFHGPVRYVLHDGTTDPVPPRGVKVKAGSTVAGAERQQLLAAFNGGFLMRSHAGGYIQETHVFKTPRHGLASLVIDRSGQARIGVWGDTVPAPGETVYSVRQNLWALVLNGQVSTQAARWQRWGGTVGRVEYVARSALGQDAAGNLIYVASMSATPEDLAQALAQSGAVIGMEMDINPEWVQLDTASAPGGPLSAAIPGQNRPADQYVSGWTRDFITVLAPSGV